MFHLLAYQTGAAATATPDLDMTAVPDSVFTARNGHFIFSERYKMLASFQNGVTPTRRRLNMPSLNTLGRHHFWPLEASATVPDLPGIADYRDFPIDIPLREELAVEATVSAAGPEQNNQLIWIGDMGWNRNLPVGQARITVRATGAVAGVANAWSGLGVLTLAENLRGGYYAMVGAQCFDAGTLAARFMFPRSSSAMVKPMRPGILCQEAIANSPLKENMGGFGVLGTFDSDEMPQVEIYANATAASVQEFRLDLIYFGNQVPQGYF